jgi:hypothetical protein
MPYISVSDLLDYITPDADLKAREAQKKARAKVINNFFYPVHIHLSAHISFFTLNISFRHFTKRNSIIIHVTVERKTRPKLGSSYR